MSVLKIRSGLAATPNHLHLHLISTELIESYFDREEFSHFLYLTRRDTSFISKNSESIIRDTQHCVINT